MNAQELRIKELEADLASCEIENNNLRQQTVDMAHLEAENERLKQDAARWQYVKGRAHHYKTLPMGYYYKIYTPITKDKNATIDSAIDAAITESEEL